VTRRLPHLALALIVLAAVLPSVALASKPKSHHKGHHSGNCGVSAVCVYVEQLQGAGGSQPIGPGSSHPNSKQDVVPLSSSAAKKVARLGGKDRRTLQIVGTSRAYGVPQQLPRIHVGDVSPPSTLLAALDLGAGPIALFATLLGAAAAYALGGVLRRRRRAG